MERIASERDQTYWACSAQNEKMLPKPEKQPGSGVASFKAGYKAATT